MNRRLKLIAGLSTLSLTGALAVSGCGSEGEGEGAADGDGAPVEAVGGEGEGASEGEGVSEGEGEGAVSEGEGEGVARSGDPASDDVEYLYRLGMVRGHLAAFIELYRAGAVEMAATHAKHPESEIYKDLAPAFATRGEPGFADTLNALATAAANGGEVETLYAQTVAAIRASAPQSNEKTTLLAVSHLVATAAEEFDIGVNEDGVVVEPHEYQDAFGFLSAAREIVSEIETRDINAGEAVAIAHEQIDLALASFDGLVVSETEGVSSTLFGAAARIEIAALGL